MYNSVITGKENASKEWNYVISMYLRSFNTCFVFGYNVYFMCYWLKTAIYLAFFGQRLPFFGEDRLATCPGQVPAARNGQKRTLLMTSQKT